MTFHYFERQVTERMKSWKTTLLGVLMIIGALSTAGVALMDNDPTTNPDTALIMVAITGGVGLINAKDSNK